MLLVVDAQKGIQTQTAECLIIGELLQKKLIVVINKIDVYPEDQRESKLEKLRSRLSKTLAATSFGGTGVHGAEILYSQSFIKVC